jgi:DNA polymerase-3 subunit epsilon
MADDPSAMDPRAAVDALLEDPALAALDAVRAPFDPLAVLGWSGRERAHTRFLAWLVDPRDPSPDRAHGLGVSALRALVTLALDALDGETDRAAPQALEDVRCWREHPLGAGLRAPDVRCEWSDADGTPWVLLVEDKLDAAEGDAQLWDYLDWMRHHRPGHRRLLVYLTPDGRPPSSVRAAPELAVLRWGALAGAFLHAMEGAADTDASRFVAASLRAMRARFDASPSARASIAALHARHPVAAEVLAAAGGDPALRQRVAARFPTAAWLLRTHAPREAPLSARWAQDVAEAFNALAPQGPRMRVGAPGVRCDDRVSWSFDGLTDRLALHVMAWPGHLRGHTRARLFVALHAPNRAADVVFTEREQTALVAALPAATQAWLRGATPVRGVDGAWKWLRVGPELQVPGGFDAADLAARGARAVTDLVSAHLGALAVAFADPAHRLFSADLDDDHLLPVDTRDREALYAEARPDARHAVILAAPAGALEVRRRVAADLGALFAGAYGGTGALSYDYDGAFALGLAPRGRPLTVVPLAAVDREDAGRVAAAIARGGDVVLLGCVDDAARAALRGVLDGCAGTLARNEIDGAGSVRWAGVSTTVRDARGLGARCDVAPGPGAVTVATVETAGGERPLVLAWSVGGARVVLLAAEVASLRGLPELFARWFRALLGALEVPLAPSVSVSPAPSVPVSPAPRRVLAPTTRRRTSAQAVMPWAAQPKLPAAAQAGVVLQDLDEVVIVDTETTGLSGAARLVEIGALHVRGAKVVARFQTLVDPEEPIPKMVIRVHGITDAMVKGAPTARDAIRDWVRFVGGRPVVAHNASFDHRMFAQESARVGLRAHGLAFWCTKRFAKAAFPQAPGYGLGALAQWLQLPSPPAHRAIADCITTHGLLAACRATAPDAALSVKHGPPKPL